MILFVLFRIILPFTVTKAGFHMQNLLKLNFVWLFSHQLNGYGGKLWFRRLLTTNNQLQLADGLFFRIQESINSDRFLPFYFFFYTLHTFSFLMRVPGIANSRSLFLSSHGTSSHWVHCMQMLNVHIYLPASRCVCVFFLSSHFCLCFVLSFHFSILEFRLDHLND